MKRNDSKRVLAVFLIVLMLLTGCAAGPVNTPADQSTKPEEEPVMEPAAEPETAPDTERSRLPVEWARDAVIYEVNVRQYTEEGTFAAFSEHLAELRDMGVTTLWFMPVHPISQTKRSGTLGSYYSISDYREVNPEFGTKEDFKALIDQAHDLGFTVMLDWVANHTGWVCAWIKEHPASPFPQDR